MALLASGTVCEVREVHLARKPPALLMASPKGTVPVLVLQDGTVLQESLDIMRWALQRQDLQRWLPISTAAMEQTMALIAQNDGDFKYHLDRYKYPTRYNLSDGQLHRVRAAEFMHILDRLIQAHGYLHGGQFGLADAAIAPFVRQFAHTDPGWFANQPWLTLQAWLAAFESSEIYLGVMEKHPPWVERDTAQVN
jgi:glutathione S-transferase